MPIIVEEAGLPPYARFRTVLAPVRTGFAEIRLSSAISQLLRGRGRAPWDDWREPLSSS
jgi:hypothetical protein